jgi:hypothetical protein
MLLRYQIILIREVTYRMSRTKMCYGVFSNKISPKSTSR